MKPLRRMAPFLIALLLGVLEMTGCTLIYYVENPSEEGSGSSEDTVSEPTDTEEPLPTTGENNLDQIPMDTTTEEGGGSGGGGENDEPTQPPVLPHCGNGIQEEGEACDDQDVDDKTCLSLGEEAGSLFCKSDCTFDTSSCMAFCGNGIVEPGEECDVCQANVDCNQECQFVHPPTCGNGQIENGETCDDGNQVNGDGCNAVCLMETCGNNQKDDGETCDDGNQVNGDGCQADCQITKEICGVGIMKDPSQY